MTYQQLNDESLRQGACYALEHCTHLAEDAAIMYAAKRFSTSFCLAVMAREELGRANLLWKKSIELGAGGTVSAEEVANQLTQHKDKLRAGQSIIPIPMEPEDMAKLSAAIATDDITGIEAISEEIQKRATAIRKHAPSALHKRRLQAQYVDLDPHNGTWSTPSGINKAEARSLIQTVMSEIANTLIRAASDPMFFRACEQIGLEIPQMGPFTHRVFSSLANGDS